MRAAGCTLRALLPQFPKACKGLGCASISVQRANPHLGARIGSAPTEPTGKDRSTGGKVGEPQVWSVCSILLTTFGPAFLPERFWPCLLALAPLRGFSPSAVAIQRPFASDLPGAAEGGAKRGRGWAADVGPVVEAGERAELQRVSEAGTARRRRLEREGQALCPGEGLYGETGWVGAPPGSPPAGWVLVPPPHLTPSHSRLWLESPWGPSVS